MIGGLARAVAGVVSPQHRHWRTLVRSLTYDPDASEAALVAPGDRDFLICGSPRTGTALLVAMLFQPPRVVTVMEPWDALRLPPAELFDSLRREIRQTGRLSRGRLDVPALRADAAVTWCRDGEKPVELTVDEDHLLGIKLPAFWRYLPLLPKTKFLVCLRHPHDVIRSYRATGGRLGQGLDYDAALNRRMNEELTSATSDPAVRRVLMYDYVNARILPFLDQPNVFTVRYERWEHDPDALLAELSEFLGEDVRRPLAAVRRSRSPVDPEEHRLIQQHCSTAEALGYRL